jgi:hypothetical protein
MAKDLPALSRILVASRIRRGWSAHAAAEHMGIYPFSLRNLEQGKQKGPGHVTIRVALRIIQTYWPEVTLEDFTGERSALRLIPKRSSAAAHQLKQFLPDETEKVD